MGDETFWTESLFHSELSNLISQLSLSSYDILGHSWGGMMASTFAAARPQGLRKLVLSNVAATSDAWDNAYDEYRRELPREIQDTMKTHEDAGTTASLEYQEVIGIFNKKHFCSIVPNPEEFQASLDWRAKEQTVTLTM